MRVLVVDDEPMVRRALARGLGNTLEVVLAEDGVGALALVDSGATFDVILSDVHMRSMGGLELFRVLRNRAPTLAGCLLLMSGGLTEDEMNEVARWSIPLLLKPIAKEALRSIVAQQICRAREEPR
jgi:CheY-like chemotaxis protein